MSAFDRLAGSRHPMDPRGLLSIVVAFLAVLPACSPGSDGSPVVTPQGTPPAWIYDGRRLLRYDLAKDVLTRERLPGASLPLDDAAPDGTVWLEAGKPQTYLQWFLPSPDDRFLVYGLAASGDTVRLYAWDRKAGGERLLAEGRWTLVRFLEGPSAALVAAEDSGAAIFDLATGRSGRRDGVYCSGLTAGDRLLATFATTTGVSACGVAVEARVLSWDGSAVLDVPLTLPWEDPQVFIDGPASTSRNGQAALSAYRRNQPDGSRSPLVRCNLPAATCVEVSTSGQLVPTWTPMLGFRNLSRDGRTLAFADPAQTDLGRLRIEADGASREIDAGGRIELVHACDGATEVFVEVGTGSAGEITGQRIARVAVGEGEPKTVWSSSRSAFAPVSFDLSDARDRLLVVEYEVDSGTDVVRFFPRQARLVDVATGTDAGRIADGGVPSVWSPDLKHVLVTQNRGPGGLTLVAGDPAGPLHTVASWADPRQAVLRIASRACPSGFCTLQECEAKAPLAEAPAVTLDGAGEAYDIAEDGTVATVVAPSPGTPGVLEVTTPAGTRRFIVDLPPPSNLPLAVGQHVSLVASRTPGTGGAGPRQVFAALDAGTPAAKSVVFLGGPLVPGKVPACAGLKSCPWIDFGNTGCAPDEVPGCGAVDHPPLVISESGSGWPFQVQPGAEGGQAELRATVYATARPVDGPCTALGEGTVFALIVIGEAI